MNEQAIVDDPPARGVSFWVSKGGFAVLDQALFAGANFVLNVLLARWLTPVAYGTFTLAYSSFLLIASFHTAAFTEPMLIYGSGRYEGRFRRYLGMLVAGHWLATLAVAGLALGIAAVLWLADAPTTATALGGLALALPFILMMWLVRRAFYVQLRPQGAAACGLLYLLVLLGGTYALYIGGLLGPGTALAWMGAASIAAFALAWPMLRPRRFPFRRLWPAKRHAPTDADLPAAVRADHWRYARWAFPNAGLDWIGANVHYFILVSAASLATVGTMRALDLMLMPYWQGMAALHTLLLPMLSKDVEASTMSLGHFVRRYVAPWSLLSILATAALALFGPYAMSLVYGDHYTAYAGLLGWYALILVPETVVGLVFLLLRAYVRTDLVFLLNGIFSAALVAGLWGGVQFGLEGLIYARIGVAFLMFAVALIVLLRTLRPAR